MSEFEAFLCKDSLKVTESLVISERFKIKGEPVIWELCSISEAQNRKLKSEIIFSKSKINFSDEIDFEEYLLRLVAKCVKHPELKNAELQAAYGVVGETALLEAMLLPGEYALLLSAVKRINKFDESLPTLCDSAKK